jgi:hypothetical protein
MEETCLIVIEEGFEAEELAAMSSCCKTAEANLRT